MSYLTTNTENITDTQMSYEKAAMDDSVEKSDNPENAARKKFEDPKRKAETTTNYGSLNHVQEDTLQDPPNWEKYLKLSEDEDISSADFLLKANILPTQTQLNTLQKRYLETKSKTISVLLKRVDGWIRKYLTRKYAHIHYAWLGSKTETNNDIAVHIIVELNKPNNTFSIEDLPYKFHVMQYNTINQEANVVNTKIGNCDKLPFSVLNDIRCSINKNAKALMENHRHLSILNSSPVRSKGFSSISSEHEIIAEVCIVFYVRNKSFIPVGEEEFQEKYDGFPIDVREGLFYTNMISSYEDHGMLKMGNTIAKKIDHIEGVYRCGTLGGFIEHPQYGLCGLTCAHVLLNDIEMAKLQDKGELSWLDFSEDAASVYLYRENQSENYIKIGRLVKAILEKGDESNAGMEVAIFQIESLAPVSGVFTDERTLDDDPVHFDSGKAFGPSRFSWNLSVFKYGSKTGKTRGVFLNRLPVITVRLQADQFPANLVMHNQVEIKGINSTLFSDKGDSGSLVMVEERDRGRFCIGIVDGITSYNSTVVTPIGPILEKMNMLSLKNFEADHMRESILRLDRLNDKLMHVGRDLHETDRYYNSRCIII